MIRKNHTAVRGEPDGRIACAGKVAHGAGRVWRMLEHERAPIV
ncbi:hypothetical protein [Pseudothauera hydrothermalis]|jgi:hypothetical protein|nr:hypothetical protein [Pseudothauera hydrothermalis]